MPLKRSSRCFPLVAGFSFFIACHPGSHPDYGDRHYGRTRSYGEGDFYHTFPSLMDRDDSDRRRHRDDKKPKGERRYRTKTDRQRGDDYHRDRKDRRRERSRRDRDR